MLALVASCREASELNWRVTDSLGFLVRSTHNCTASDSRFEMHCETAAAATCGHMKQPTRNVYVGCFMWRTVWRLVALCFASRPIESRYIWRSVTRSATENRPQPSPVRTLFPPPVNGALSQSTSKEMKQNIMPCAPHFLSIQRLVRFCTIEDDTDVSVPKKNMLCPYVAAPWPSSTDAMVGHIFSACRALLFRVGHTKNTRCLRGTALVPAEVGVSLTVSASRPERHPPQA